MLSTLSYFTTKEKVYFLEIEVLTFWLVIK